jgi:hypothetical protein
MQLEKEPSLTFFLNFLGIGASGTPALLKKLTSAFCSPELRTAQGRKFEVETGQGNAR